MSSYTQYGRPGYYSHFLGGVIPTEVTGTSENSGTAATVVAKAGGVVGLITGTSSGNRSQIATGLNLKAEDGTMIFVATVMNLTAITTRALFIGWTDTVSLENPIEINGTTVTSTATDAVGFVYDTDATIDGWHYLAVKADVDKGTVGTAVSHTPIAGTYNEFRLEVNVDGDAAFYIDGVPCGTIENAITPTVLMTPTVLVETRTTAASTVYVDALMYEGAADQTP